MNIDRKSKMQVHSFRLFLSTSCIKLREIVVFMILYEEHISTIPLCFLICIFYRRDENHMKQIKLELLRICKLLRIHDFRYCC